MIETKICGLKAPEPIRAAIDHGARYIGFVFYERSPRNVGAELAGQLARMAGTAVRTVGLFVEPRDDELDDIVPRVPLNMLQLHGEEVPGRVAEIRARYSIPVMKAVRVASAQDIENALIYQEVADWLLFDARPPENVAALPGGNGLTFDWSLLAGRRFERPWMLSGGLDAANVAEAVRITGAQAVDVSSGVEDRPGHKTPDKIEAFLQAVAEIEAVPAA